MEYRQCIRKPIKQKILLESPHSGLSLTAVGDISLGGMFVGPCPTGLKLGSHVVVSFALPLLGKRHGFRFQATVVRMTRDGAGLMFTSVPPNTLRTFGDALFEASARPNRTASQEARTVHG